MWFRILGPVVTRQGAGWGSVTAGKQRALLAILLVNRGRSLERDWLIETLWDGRPVATAQKVLAQYVWRLRTLLSGAEGCELRTTASGYMLMAPDGELDSVQFSRLVDDGRVAADASDVERAISLNTEALALWRGPALADTRSLPALEAEALRLDERRVEAREMLADLQVASGWHADALPTLEELIAAEPYRERPWRLYMLALYRAGRRPDALAAFQRLWQVWADELGIEPNGELRALHQRILTDDPTLAPESAPPGTVLGEAATVVRPAQLPADLSSFVGRATELDRLLAVLADGSAPATVVISAIDGMAGIGKTTLAVHAAHRLATRFPDGQLFIDLHGYTQGVAPVSPADALDRMLRALGIAGLKIPRELDERAAMLRSVLAGRRVLLVLDNAATEAQVRPLLPGTAGCLVLVTSRHRLIGLEDARPVSLDVLPLADALALFARVSGVSEPVETLTEIVELCDRLPLAIGIAAARLRNHPRWTLGHLAERLRDHRHRLTELNAGDRNVATAIELSYQYLTADQQRAFRLLGLHPGTDFDPHAVGALTDTTTPQVGRLLDALIDAHLLVEHVPGRYRFHDLVRAHAAATAERVDSEPDRHAAVGRLLDHYSHATAVAMDLVYPHEADRRPALPPPRTPPLRLADPAAATGWLAGWRAGQPARHRRTGDHLRHARPYGGDVCASVPSSARWRPERAGPTTARARSRCSPRDRGPHR